MKWFARVVGAMAVLAILALIATFPIEQSYRSRAKLMQRAQVDADRQALFGDGVVKIGEPQLMIVEDPKAVLDGQGDRGAVLLNEAYLKEKGIYPLQLVSIEFFTGMARMVAGGFLALVALGYGVARLRRRKPAVVAA